MKKIALSLFLILCQANLFAADRKVTELTASTSVSTDDLLMVIDDPSGSPANKKITVSNFAATMPASGSTTQVQYNNSGVFGADSTFTHDSATGTVTSYAYSAALGESRIQDTTYGGYIDFNDSTNLGTVRIGSVGNLYNNSVDIDAESTFETIKITSATNVQLFDFGLIGVLSSNYLSSPNIYGGSATGSALNIYGSSNAAPTASHIYLNSAGFGNVGIGTSTTLNKLHVRGTASGAAGIYLNDAAPGTTTNTLYNSGGSLYWNGSVVGGGSGTVSTGVTGYFAYYPSPGGTTVDDQTILYTDGTNVGIGTTTVSAGKLVVSGNTSSTTFNKVTLTAPATGSTVTVADGKTLTASNTLTLAGTDSTTITFQGTGTYISRDSTDTLTNKRKTRRAGSTTSSATPTINTDNVDKYSLTAQAADITSFTTNLSGTPVEGDFLEIQIKDNGTARAITWGASFQSSGNVALPSTTVISTTLRILFEWDSVASKWTCVAVA